MKGPVIAVDGPAGSGKTTIAKAVASRLSATHIDTGAMYRAFALKLLETAAALDPEVVSHLLDETDIRVGDGEVVLDGRDVSRLIRSAEVTKVSSRVAVMPAVREWMVERQRAIAGAVPAAVVEGRDIGTVVLPDADLKIYLTASETERARRRAVQTGADAARTAVDIAERDTRDINRAVSPLKAAADAVVLDTTGLSIEQVVEAVLEILAERSKRDG